MGVCKPMGGGNVGGCVRERVSSEVNVMCSESALWSLSLSGLYMLLQVDETTCTVAAAECLRQQVLRVVTPPPLLSLLAQREIAQSQCHHRASSLS